MKRDVLWLGVHKTGTTFLQKSLDLSQAALKANNIHYVLLEEFRRHWTRPLLYEGEPVEGSEAPMRPAGQQWLVFDENIPALVQHGLTKRGLYPETARNARIIADATGLQAPDLVLALRGFGGFLPSLYCEALKSTPFRPFKQFMVQRPEAMTWLPMINSLLVSFPQSRLFLYRAEDLPGQEAELLAQVLGMAPQDFTLLTEAERVGFSQAAVDQMTELAKTRELTRPEVHQIVRDLPRGPDRPAFAPFGKKAQKVLAAAYEADLEALRRKAALPMSRITLLLDGAERA